MPRWCGLTVWIILAFVIQVMFAKLLGFNGLWAILVSVLIVPLVVVVGDNLWRIYD